MVYRYYPGCTLRTKAKDLDKAARASAEVLGLQLQEVPEWQCCGAVYPLAEDEIATRLSAVRVLQSAKESGEPLLTVCSACHHVLKRVNYDMQQRGSIWEKANRYLELSEPYSGEVAVVHYLEALRDAIGFNTIKERVVNPLKGRKVATYYGCLLLRPSGVMAMDDPENPTIMEDIINSLGAEAVVTPYRNECCGGYIRLENPELAEKRTKEIIEAAIRAGADSIVTACPLCLYNLHKTAESLGIKVVYFSELLAEALGV